MLKTQSQKLLDKAEEQEKKYSWLGAIDYYKKASKSALEDKDFSKTAILLERIGYCFFRAALQSKTNDQFRRRMTLSAKNYGRMINPLQKLEGEEAKINHAKAMVAYASSWIESDFSKMAALLDKWWTLEYKTLSVYEKERDFLKTGRTCNNLMEGAADRWIFFNAKEYEQRRRELSFVGEKAIKTLSKTNDCYELARAYCWAAWYNGLLRRATEESKKKWLIYSEKALYLSKKIEDAWLIGWSHNGRWIGALLHDFASVLDNTRNLAKQGEIAKDNYMITVGKWASSLVVTLKAQLEEDPEKQRKSLRKAMKLAEEAIRRSQIISYPIGTLLSQNSYVACLNSLTLLEPHLKEKRILLGKASEVGRKSLEYASRAYSQGQVWTHVQYPYDALSKALFWLAKTEKRSAKKKQLLEESLKYRKEEISFLRQNSFFVGAWNFFQLGEIQSELARTEATKKEKTALLDKAITSFKDSIKAVKTAEPKSYRAPTTVLREKMKGNSNRAIGEALIQIYSLTKERTNLSKAIVSYHKAAEAFKNAELPTYAAEAKWKAAGLHDRLCDYTRAADTYLIAAKKYNEAASKISHLQNYYESHSLYMQAWSRIEQARYNHSIEEYEKAKQHYEKAAKLHESTEPWSYLAPNYFAWAEMEKAESLSRKEISQEAKQTFQKALARFTVAEKSIKQKTGEITSPEEKEMTHRLLQALELRRKFCQARIQIEEAKLLDRQGKYLQSSKSFREATHKLDSIIKETETEAEQKELELLATLCRAWEKMAIAEETNFSESYLEAASFFEKAKEYCYTKKASLWTVGNSNFCKGLAAGARYQGSMDLKENALAKSYLKNAASCYLQAGFKNASEYAKATQRLFDAYIFMNQAEKEVNPESRTKQYQMAENLLQISAGSFAKAKQPEKTAQVQQILKSVREEKALAVSLNEVMHAPTITSSTMSFTAPSPTSEVSVGLDQFQHANVQANIITGKKEVKIGESFCLSVEFVNAGKEPALLTRVEDFVPPDFIVVKKPEIYRLEESCLNMKGKQIAPLKLVEAKLVLQPSKKGVYQLKPTVHYLDELGQNKTLQLKSIEIKVEEVILADRVSTGTRELDSILLGGIPEESAVVLTGPPSDERELIIRNFLKTGIKEGQTSFYVTTETVGIENLLEKSGFYLFLCNPKPKNPVPDLPNITWLKSKTDLNNLNMALVRASRNVQQEQGVKRIVIGNVSDVLLKDGPEVTRRWLSELISDLCSKGFTILAVINPEMHTPEQTGAVLDLFDGEISIAQTIDPLECKKSIVVKKLRGQDYIKNPICLTKS